MIKMIKLNEVIESNNRRKIKKSTKKTTKKTVAKSSAKTAKPRKKTPVDTDTA